jgi:hypothetical protein
VSWNDQNAIAATERMAMLPKSHGISTTT